MPTEHAPVSPSGSEIWINCPPSMQLQKQFPDEDTEYAEEGTGAHLLSEALIHQKLKDRSPLENILQFEQVQLPGGKYYKYYSPEMLRYAKAYCAYVLERYAEALSKSEGKAKIYIEQRIDVSHIIPDCWGTGDCIIVWPGHLEMIDLKYGKGVLVDAWGNPQQQLYACGALKKFTRELKSADSVVAVDICIYQPRKGHIDRWATNSTDVLAWAHKIALPAAKLAFAGEGEFKPGEHCRFCTANHMCRSRGDYCLEVVNEDVTDPLLLTAPEVSAIILRARQIESWLKAVKDYALKQALAGKKYPGLKIVRGSSKRFYTDQAGARDVLINDLMFDESEIGGFELKGITELEKLIGPDLFNEYIGPFLSKPDGGPTFAPSTDKRPDFSPADTAAEDFKHLIKK